MDDFKWFIWGFTGYSLAQLLGLIFSGYGLFQGLILYLIFCTISLIPGFIKSSNIIRNEGFNKNIIAYFIPSLISITILTIGFLIGVYLA